MARGPSASLDGGQLSTYVDTMAEQAEVSYGADAAAVRDAQDLGWDDGLRMVSELRDLGSELEGHFVGKARGAGVSWEQIGLALGVSRQAAHARHHR